MRVCGKVLQVTGDVGRTIGICLAGTLFCVLAGCDLPFPGPYEGRVTDSETLEPISGARVDAEWWCHDNPLPDLPGSFSIRSSTFTDERGLFRLERETRRGGIFGSQFVLRISSEGYIPAHLVADASDIPLPPGTEAYPFIETSKYKEFPARLTVELTPAIPVLLKALKSGIPLHQRVAREKLTKLMGVDYGYHADKWEKAVESRDGGGIDPVGEAPPKRLGCPCPESVHKFRRPREVRTRVRRLVRAAALGDMKEVKSLLADGVDCNARNYGCRSALMKASSNGRYQLVEFLLSEGADVNAKDDNCRTALMKASSYNRSEILDLLLSHGAQVNAADKDGMTALMSAAMFGHMDAVRVLLSGGAEVNQKDKDGETAWFKAAVVNHKEVMKILKSHGRNR